MFLPPPAQSQYSILVLIVLGCKVDKTFLCAFGAHGALGAHKGTTFGRRPLRGGGGVVSILGPAELHPPGPAAYHATVL